MGLAAAVATVGCFSNAGRRDDGSIRITGSDTMVNLAQAWAEAYQKTHPDISLQVRGGGSGVGIAALINGKVDIAPASRAMTDDEIELAKEKTGKEPKQFVVGRDALAIYVHRDNPLNSISIDELAEIYGEGGKINKWEQLGVDNTRCSDGEIVRMQTAEQLGHLRLLSRDGAEGRAPIQTGHDGPEAARPRPSTLVSNTPCAIGYSGMGYNQPGEVKMLKVSAHKGEPGGGAVGRLGPGRQLSDRAAAVPLHAGRADRCRAGIHSVDSRPTKASRSSKKSAMCRIKSRAAAGRAANPQAEADDIGRPDGFRHDRTAEQ